MISHEVQCMRQIQMYEHVHVSQDSLSRYTMYVTT